MPAAGLAGQGSGPPNPRGGNERRIEGLSTSRGAAPRRADPCRTRPPHGRPLPLVERPGTDIEAQADVLTRTVDIALKGAPVDAPGTLDQAAEHLIRTLIADTDTSDDDVTLLLLGLLGPAANVSRA
ncbi:hypothetical protein ABT116_28280 [Streptomyces sp. NPDC002130]|uniref:hypothetical protein n=1 Tax=Streptomyces sp. NPDC002130 TaxID=3155568 RepID=UPI0033227A07